MIFLLAGVLFGISTYAQTSEDRILGKWTNSDQTQLIEFIENGSTYEAIILESDEASLVGKKQITHLKFHKNKKYKGGTVHILRKNRTANCSANLLSEDELELKVSFGLLSKSAIWTRVKN